MFAIDSIYGVVDCRMHNAEKPCLSRSKHGGGNVCIAISFQSVTMSEYAVIGVVMIAANADSTVPSKAC